MPARDKPQAPDTFLDKNLTKGTISRETNSHLSCWHHSQATSSSACRHLMGGFPCSHHCTFSIHWAWVWACQALHCFVLAFLPRNASIPAVEGKAFPCCALINHEATVFQQIGVHSLVIHQHAFLSYIHAASH